MYLAHSVLVFVGNLVVTQFLKFSLKLGFLYYFCQKKVFLIQILEAQRSIVKENNAVCRKVSNFTITCNDMKELSSSISQYSIRELYVNTQGPSFNSFIY